MQQLISWSKLTWLCYISSKYFIEASWRVRVIVFCQSPLVITVKNRFKVPKSNIIQVKSSNKQVPDSSGSNEKRFLKGRSPAFFRHKRLRARYGYTGPSRAFAHEQQTDLSESYYAQPCKSILDLVTRASSTQEVGLQTLVFLCKRYLLKKASKDSISI